MFAAMNSVLARLIASSWSASTIQVGTLMRYGSVAFQFGWVSHILVIWVRKGLYSRGVGDSFSYSVCARAMKALNTGLWAMSATPLGSELAAKANSFVTRSGWCIAMSRPMIAPS